MQPRSQKPYQKLQGLDALFGENESANATKTTAPLSLIHLNSRQPRRYFDPQKMQQLVESIKQRGILENLLVRPVPETNPPQYELVAGERRYRAAQEIGLTQVPITILELTNQEALEIALIENLQREDLNPIEETEGILRLLASHLGTTSEEVITLLNRKAYLDRRTDGSDEITDNVIRNQWPMVEQVFSLIGKLSSESFRVNRLPLLNLPTDILKALRQGQIAYTKAKAISRLKDEAKRKELLEEAIAEELSLSQIQERIKLTSTQIEMPRTLKSRLSEMTHRYTKSKAWDDPKKQKRLEKLLAQMEKLLAEE